MKKIIESELISIAHRILKLKDKADIDALYNESKNVFEKISVLKFYEDNKFRIDPNITDDIIENALFEKNDNIDNNTLSEVSFSLNDSKTASDSNQEFVNHSMDLEMINELLEDSEKSDVISFDEKINDSFSNHVLEVSESISVLENSDEDLVSENVMLTESDYENEVEEEIKTLEIDPVFNIQLEEIQFEEKAIEQVLDIKPSDLNLETKKHLNIENQHLLDISEDKEIPFHQVPLNKTINDAFSHMITVGLNDRIAFEKNLFDGSSEDLNRVLSQLNTIETYQEAQDFIDDLVKPDFNYWKGKEEYEERFMQLIQKRFL